MMYLENGLKVHSKLIICVGFVLELYETKQNSLKILGLSSHKSKSQIGQFFYD